jgi:hypothetical protein
VPIVLVLVWLLFLVVRDRLTELEEKHSTLERVSGRTAKAATEYEGGWEGGESEGLGDGDFFFSVFGSRSVVLLGDLH